MMIRLNEVEWYDRDSLLRIYYEDVEEEGDGVNFYYINFETKEEEHFTTSYTSKENRDYWLNNIIHQINNN